MGEISKNIYNTTIYIYSIYNAYKEEIFKITNQLAKEKHFNDEQQIHEHIEAHLQFFYDLRSNKDSQFNINIPILNGKIKEKLQDRYLVNDNFQQITNELLIENQTITHNSCYEFKFIIDEALKRRYLCNYNKTVYEINNHIPISINDPTFIEQVKQGINLFPKEESNKNLITEFKLQSNQNIITRFIYKHLGENKDKLPSDVIINIIKKAFGNYSSFYALAEKGLKPKKPKYLDKSELFILPFFVRSFKIISEKNLVRLTVGKYVAEHYKEITKNNELICLNNDEETEYKKYCHVKKLIDIPLKASKAKTKNMVKPEMKKMNKEVNYIVDDKYIDRKSDKIIEGYYIYIQIPTKLAKESIKLIEINPIYDGRYFKANFVYDVEKVKQEPIKIRQIKPHQCISIDLGIVNLMTIYDPSGQQRIIKGGSLLSINSYYNYKLDNLQSKIDTEPDKDKRERLQNYYYKTLIDRKNKINDFFNKLVKYMFIEYNTKDLIVIGYNLNWKNGVNMGKKNNRKFYNIPYAQLISKLKNKFGNKIKMNEESYTSKCCALGLSEIGKSEDYGGKRINRGRYSSKEGLINADLNGAINILRKVIKLTEIQGSGIFNPIVVKIITPTIVKYSNVKYSREVTEPADKETIGVSKKRYKLI